MNEGARCHSREFTNDIIHEFVGYVRPCVQGAEPDFYSGIEKENIIGIEAPLWSETVSDRAEAEYMLFPRLQGYAEIGWTPSEMRSWDDYRVRLADHGERMKVMDIGFFPSGQVEWKQHE